MHAVHIVVLEPRVLVSFTGHPRSVIVAQFHEPGHNIASASPIVAFSHLRKEGGPKAALEDRLLLVLLLR
jgi:hypothetical protein